MLGLDKVSRVEVADDADFNGADQIALPSITQEELTRSDAAEQEKDLLLSPLTNADTNPALNGAVVMAIWTSAIESRPDDIILVAGFYDVFEPFYAGLSFIDSAMVAVKECLEKRFPGRGKTLFIQIKDRARGIEPFDPRFPSALREMINTANAVPSLPSKERDICCSDLLAYLEKLSATPKLDENVQKVVSIFEGRINKWQELTK